MKLDHEKGHKKLINAPQLSCFSTFDDYNFVSYDVYLFNATTTFLKLKSNNLVV